MSRSLSVYLDVLRFNAALWVFLAHVSLLVPAAGLPDLWWTAEDAVMGFFVLSGFVVAYTAERQHAGLRDYAVARLARLYSVVVPALLFAFAVDQIGRHLAPALDPSWSGGNPLGRMLVGMLFLNELWFTSLRAPSNTPYWSIGYEFWYYAIFGLAFYLRGRRRVLAVGAAALIAGPKILMLAPIWALGVLAWRLKDRVVPRAGLVLFAGPIVAYFAAYVLEVRPALEWRAHVLVPGGINIAWSDEYWWKFCMGVLSAANLVGFAAIARHLRLAAVERPVRWLAGMTFSIYLFHWPLLTLVTIFAGAQATPAWPAWVTVLLLAGVLAAVAALAEISERRKEVARHAIEALLARLPRALGSAGPPPGRAL